MNEPSFRILRVIEAAADVAAARRAHDDGTARASAGAVTERRRLIYDLIEATTDEVGKLHLGDRAIAALRRADAHADDGRFGNRRVETAGFAEFIHETGGHTEGAAIGAHVFAEHEHFRIAAHLFEQRFANRFEIGNFLRHSVGSYAYRSVTASSGAGSGLSSANRTASSSVSLMRWSISCPFSGVSTLMCSR